MPMKQKKTATIQLRLHPNTARKIKDFARNHNRTITGIMLAGVMNYIKNKEEKFG